MNNKNSIFRKELKMETATKTITLKIDNLQFTNEFGGTTMVYFCKWTVVEVEPISAPNRKGNFRGKIVKIHGDYKTDAPFDIDLEFYFNTCWEIDE